MVPLKLSQVDLLPIVIRSGKGKQRYFKAGLYGIFSLDNFHPQLLISSYAFSVTVGKIIGYGPRHKKTSGPCSE